MTTTIQTTTCPTWCTDPGPHPWEGDERMHSRPVSGFTLYATEHLDAAGASTFTEPSCHPDFERFDTSADARELVGSLAEVGEIMAAIEQGREPTAADIDRGSMVRKVGYWAAEVIKAG